MNRIPQPAPKQNLNDQIRGDLIFLIIGCFVLYVVGRFFEWLFMPLRAISQKDTEARVEEKIAEKKYARTLRFFYNPNDPMYQFQLRFVKEPENYKKDPDNEVYYAWFEEWKNGNIIDSTLRWAPNILDGTKMRYNFLQYMKIQWALHKKSSLLKRMQFTNTIHKYYPEFSASMKGLEEDLAQYEAEIDEEKLEKELQDEIQKFGLSEDLAKYLIEKDINSKELRIQAKFLKEYSEQGYCSEACICAVENNLSKEEANIVNDLVTKTCLPAKVAIAYVNGEMTKDDFDYVFIFMDNILESYGTEAFEVIDGKTVFDDRLDILLKGFKEKKIIAHLNKKG